MAAESTAQQVSVIIPCHTIDRLPYLELAIESVKQQEVEPAELVVAVDHEPALAEILSKRFPEITIIENKFERGASGNRNSGAAAASTSLIAFLDDDARARPGWLQALVKPFVDPNVVCTGGFVAPDWSGTEPRWFPPEFAWVVGASHLGLPTRLAKVRNVWAENMAVRASVFSDVRGFRGTFGKVGSVSRPEDTDLCIRMGKEFPGASLVFVPSAIVDHHVGPERMTVRFFLRRSYYEGRGKVELAQINDGTDDLGDEAIYLRRTIFRGFARYARNGLVNHDMDDLRRIIALAGGLGAAATGAAVSGIDMGVKALRPGGSDRA
jgi:GT2 family glycosyltransferase